MRSQKSEVLNRVAAKAWHLENPVEKTDRRTFQTHTDF
jgi:hypothetical protein